MARSSRTWAWVWPSARSWGTRTTSVPNPPTFPDAVGHLNAWPVQVLPDARRDGSIEDEFVAPNFLYSRLRGQGAEVVQYNHPRAGVAGLTGIGLFNNIGYDPNLPLDSSADDGLLAARPSVSSGVATPAGCPNNECHRVGNTKPHGRF